MIYTARQLEQLHRSDGRIVLPYRARLTPLAMDWLRAKKIAVGYGEMDAKPVDVQTTPPVNGKSNLLWWCDGPCGVAKAALAAAAKEVGIMPSSIASESTATAAAIKHLVGEMKAARAIGGIFIVQNAAMALVFANRCASLRAVLGTSQTTIEESLRSVAPNVLVIEYPRQTLQQMKNMILRFARGIAEPSEAVKRDLKEMMSCG